VPSRGPKDHNRGTAQLVIGLRPMGGHRSRPYRGRGPGPRLGAEITVLDVAPFEVGAGAFGGDEVGGVGVGLVGVADPEVRDVLGDDLLPFVVEGFALFLVAGGGGGEDQLVGAGIVVAVAVVSAEEVTGEGVVGVGVEGVGDVEGDRVEFVGEVELGGHGRPIDDLEVGFDADFFPLLLDDLPPDLVEGVEGEGEGLTVLLAETGGTEDPTGFVEEGGGLGRVVVEDGGVLLGRPPVVGEDGVVDLGAAVPGEVGDGLAVEGVGERLADAEILEKRFGEVELDVLVGLAALLGDAEIGAAFEGIEGVEGESRGVDFARFEGGDQGVGVEGDEAEDDSVEGGAAAVVGLVCLADDAVAGVPGFEDEGAGADRGAGEGVLKQLGDGSVLKDVFGDDELVGGDGEEGGGGGGEMGLKGVVVDDFDAGDLGGGAGVVVGGAFKKGEEVVELGAGGIVGVGDDLPGELDVLSGEGLTVVPGDALAKGEDVGFAVLADGPGFDEVGGRFAIGTGAGQAVEEGGGGDDDGREGAERGENVGAFLADEVDGGTALAFLVLEGGAR
jgi:hypothetical protein